MSPLLPLLLASASLLDPGAKVTCEGRYPGHLQGVCRDETGALYWSFTTVLVKTDAEGHRLQKRDVASHHGDLCFQQGKVYVAVNRGKFNEPPGQADSWIYVYRAEDLSEQARHPTPEVVHGAGGIGCDGRRFLVVGGLPPGVDENYAYEYDLTLHFVQRHVLASGYTRKGIQTATFAQDQWWFGCYGEPRPKILLKTDGALRLLGRYECEASLGLVSLPDGGFLVADDEKDATSNHTAWLSPAVPDPVQGLRRIQP